MKVIYLNCGMKVILALRGSLSFTQSFLLLTDLPSMLTLLEEDYLECSESYTWGCPW